MEEDLNGPERRKGYRELEAKFNEHSAALEKRLARFISKGLTAFAAIGVASGIALIGFGYVLNEQSDQSDRIQEERLQTLITSCRDQNKRHELTIVKAKDLPPGAQMTVITLVDQLVPYRADCVSYAKQRVKEGL